MASEDQKERTPAEQGRQQEKSEEKVGSSPEAAKHVGGGGEFGIKAGKAEPREGAGTRPSRSGGTGARTTGVGAKEGKPGTGSEGDVDIDVIGVGSGGGVAASGDLGPTTGPEQSTGGSEEFASGGPAKGEGQGPHAGQGVGDVRPRGTSAEIHESDEEANRPHGGGEVSQPPPEDRRTGEQPGRD